jgi:arsenate reductase
MATVNVLFACVHNAGRSQMAAAWFNQLADPAKVRAVSAGTEPGAQVHPEVLLAMREVGIELADAKPQLLSDELASKSTLLITMGCGEACPVVPGLERDDWPLEDPKGKSVERVREIRDDVQARGVEPARLALTSSLTTDLGHGAHSGRDREPRSPEPRGL